MKTIEISTPDGKTIELSAPDNATQDQIKNAAQQAVAHYKTTMSQSQTTQPRAPSMAQNVADASNPANMIKSAAPSNVLGAAGVAAANAPGMASMLVNSLPGVGNPSAIPAAAANIMQNPSQGGQAAQRVLQTQGGAPTRPGDETVLSNTGKAAGTVMEMAGPSGMNKGVKPSGPFTAGFNSPETAVPGALEDANVALGKAKELAKRGDPPEVTAVLRKMMSTKGGTAKLANKAIDDIAEKGQDLTTTQLLYYRQALGRMQAEGGEAAGDYKHAFDEANSLLEARAPEVSKALAKSRLNYQATEGDEFKLPVLPMAINPGLGTARAVYRAAKIPAVSNAIGAGLGYSSPAIAGVGDSILQGFDRLRKRKENSRGK